jgi:hypothetical protein
MINGSIDAWNFHTLVGWYDVLVIVMMLMGLMVWFAESQERRNLLREDA